MKTIAIQTRSIGAVNNSGGLMATPTDWRLRSQASVAAWLPAPATPRHLQFRPKRAAAPSIWISLPAEPALEKGLLGLLALAAVIGIGYGFSCLIDLVQNWASVNATLGQIIQ
jgi:hypothetical protein